MKCEVKPLSWHKCANVASVYKSRVAGQPVSSQDAHSEEDVNESISFAPLISITLFVFLAVSPSTYACKKQLASCFKWAASDGESSALVQQITCLGLPPYTARASHCGTYRKHIAHTNGENLRPSLRLSTLTTSTLVDLTYTSTIVTLKVYTNRWLSIKVQSYSPIRLVIIFHVAWFTILPTLTTAVAGGTYIIPRCATISPFKRLSDVVLQPPNLERVDSASHQHLQQLLQLFKSLNSVPSARQLTNSRSKIFCSDVKLVTNFSFVRKMICKMIWTTYSTIAHSQEGNES